MSNFLSDGETCSDCCTTVLFLAAWIFCNLYMHSGRVTLISRLTIGFCLYIRTGPFIFRQFRFIIVLFIYRLVIIAIWHKFLPNQVSNHRRPSNSLRNTRKHTENELSTRTTFYALFCHIFVINLNEKLYSGTIYTIKIWII